MKDHERLPEVLINIGLLTDEQIRKGIKEHKGLGERISQVLVRLGFISQENLDPKLLAQFGVFPVKVEEENAPREILEKIPQEIIVTHRILPIKMEGRTLTVITDQPYNLLVLENFSSVIGMELDGLWVEQKVFERLYSRHYGGAIPSLKGTTPKPEAKKVTEAVSSEEGPIIQIVNLVIEEAVKNRASDIHVEPQEGKLRIRYRIDGVLHEAPNPPQRLQGSVLSRLKLMGGMNIAEKRLPQDGRIKTEVLGRELDLRVSSLPSLYGESIVMRILDKSVFFLGIKDLGFLPDQEKLFEQLISMPTGIFLVTGPTGSGKTTTLYAALSLLNKTDHKLITVEDPVEYQISGINQVQVKPQIHLTFSAALRSMLRQSPDVIMVGEIRDAETAGIAIQSALTGHLILSTLHTNDAPGAVTRLIDMGIKPYLVASTLQGILAQRLIRMVCPSCKTAYSPTKDELKVLEEVPGTGQYSIGKGCDQCGRSGFRGRIGIYELFRMQEPVRQLIFKRASTAQIRAKARELGMKSLREDGLAKVKLGWTTVEEIFRVAQGED
jgi:type II secretory ATPase GspE/PulE/Tfp pilus assembly ATPase PilB-like protein